MPLPSDSSGLPDPPRARCDGPGVEDLRYTPVCWDQVLATVECVATLLHRHPSLQPVVLVLKQYLYERDLHSTFTGGEPPPNGLARGRESERRVMHMYFTYPRSVVNGTLPR